MASSRPGRCSVIVGGGYDAPVTADFNLRSLIKEVCDSSMIADPQTLAKEVHRRIKASERDAALRQALPVLVQHAVSQARSSLPPIQSLYGTQVQVAGGYSSHKVARIAKAWKQMLRERTNVGPNPGDWKFLADCTAADCVYAAQIREEHVRRNAARAEQYRWLADLITKHGVKTVDELPETVLQSTLGGAA